MTTKLSLKGHITLPPKLRREQKLVPGDSFELLTDSEAGTIILKRIQQHPNDGLVDHLLACPVKGAFRPPRRKIEPMRKVRL